MTAFYRAGIISLSPLPPLPALLFLCAENRSSPENHSKKRGFFVDFKQDFIIFRLVVALPTRL